MKFYPVNRWKETGNIVKFPHCFPSKKEALKASKTACSYGDQIFTGLLLGFPIYTSINDIWKEAEND